MDYTDANAELIRTRQLFFFPFRLEFVYPNFESHYCIRSMFDRCDLIVENKVWSMCRVHGYIQTLFTCSMLFVDELKSLVCR